MNRLNLCVPNKLYATTVALSLLFAPSMTWAAEIKVVATAAVGGAFKELIPAFEHASGHKIVVQYHATPVVLKQIEAGEPFDLAIGVESAFKSAREGLFSGPQTPISTVGLGMAVRAGAPKPDLRSANSFKQALLDAKSVAILPDSVNGKHFLTVFERLGIGEQMKSKIKSQTAPPQVPQAIATGDAEMALFVSNLLNGVPGVDFVGPIPAEFQQILVFTAVLGARATEPSSAQAFVQYLRTPAAASIIKAHGMKVP